LNNPHGNPGAQAYPSLKQVSTQQNLSGFPVLAEQQEIRANDKHPHQHNHRDCVEKVRDREILII
jgi:hypothetical protein